MKRVKFREIRSLRVKLTIYALISMIATMLIMAVAFSVFQLHLMDMGINNMAILLIFSLLIFTAFFLLISYDTILYLKEIIIGIERMKNGDMTVELQVEGEDELAIIANSINEMRLRIAGEAMTKRIAEQTKDDLITNVAHDLRTPLTSIIGYLDLVKRDDILTPEQKDKYIRIVYDKAKSLENLIEDLFDYTRYEKDKFKIECSDFDLNQFMIQIVDEFYPSLSEKELTCVQDFCPEPLMVCCDGELLARAVGNLVNNAIKYGSDGKQIEVYTKKKGSNAVIQVVNYGRIIPKEDLEKVFEKFFRVEGSRSLKTGGTGLGLAIAKNIIELHKGTIQAESGPAGTVFQVELPLV
ncbi:MAG: HAMP domain-containing histidine kinase [Lachnospiraceae bacterium]|nr:HAMP domain-containing histidine kinase [Lachnospiraceae bacterium]